MPGKMTLRERMLFERLIEEAASRLSDTLLEMCADHEYRLCLIEIGYAN